MVPLTPIDPRVGSVPDVEISSLLTKRLKKFYNPSQIYTAFTAPCDHSIWLTFVAKEIKQQLWKRQARINLLELGAGCGSGLRAMKDLDGRMFHYTAQDITNTNSEQLAKVADAVHRGPVQTLPGTFDVICSFFVLEHIPNPHQFLASIGSSPDSRGGARRGLPQIRSSRFCLPVNETYARSKVALDRVQKTLSQCDQAIQGDGAGIVGEHRSCVVSFQMAA